MEIKQTSLQEIRPKAVLLFGAPGSGKGTIGSMVSAAGNHYHLSSGEVFRGLPPESEFGRLFHSYATRGVLVPDDLTIEIWRRYVSGLIDTNRFYPRTQILLLDGLPRTAAQAKILDQYVEVMQVIVLDIKDEQQIIRRIRRRAALENRPDDQQEAVILNRIHEYNQKTIEVLKHYPAEITTVINAENSTLEVLRDILDRCMKVLNQHMFNIMM